MGAANGADRPALQIMHLLRAPLGGLFRHVCDLAEEQERAGLKTGVICSDEFDDIVSSERMARLRTHCSLGVHLVDMPRMPGIGDMTALRAIAPIIRKIMPDVVHGHGAKGGAYSRLLPRAAGGLRLYTPHGGALHFSAATPQGFAFLMAEKLMAGRTHGFIFESEFSRQTFLRKVGRPHASVAVVHNGIGPSEFDSVTPQPDAADFLFIGELRELKGVATLIEAANLMGVRVHIRIVGEGPDRAEFENQAAQSLPGVRIDFLGSMPARRAFALARAVVLPSHHESLPYVALEAAGAGISLIATRVGGIPEIFGRNANRLVPARNAAALSNAMRQTMLQQDEAMEIASELQKRVKDQFSLSRMVSGVNDFYDQLLRRDAQPQEMLPATKPRLEHEATP